MGLSIIRSALLLTGLPRPMWSVEWLPLRVQHLLFPFGGLPKTKAELQLLATALGLPDCGTLVELKARCREALGPTPHRLSQLTAPATAGGGGPRQSTVSRTVSAASLVPASSHQPLPTLVVQNPGTTEQTVEELRAQVAQLVAALAQVSAAQARTHTTVVNTLFDGDGGEDSLFDFDVVSTGTGDSAVETETDDDNF